MWASVQSQMSALADGQALGEQDRAWIAREVEAQAGDTIERFEEEAQECQRQLSEIRTMNRSDVERYVNEDLDRRNILNEDFETEMRNWAGEVYCCEEMENIQRIVNLERRVDRMTGGM